MTLVHLVGVCSVQRLGIGAGSEVEAGSCKWPKWLLMKQNFSEGFQGPVRAVAIWAQGQPYSFPQSWKMLSVLWGLEMPWNSRPHIDTTASWAFFLSIVPKSSERGFTHSGGVWHMVHVAWLHGGVFGGFWRQSQQRQHLFSWGGCGRLPAFSLFLQTMSTAPDCFLQASDELPNT